jgi:uncharacterized membrane protein HdeD (DUF308 family)
MRTSLAKSWWSLVIRGAVAILLGLVTFLWPGITLSALVLLFGAYALIDGVVAIAGAWRAASAHERWFPLIFEGVFGIIAAVIAVVWPAITLLALVLIIAVWSLVTGAFEIVAAVRLRRYLNHEWLLALIGAASLLFGVMLIIFPLTGALVLAIWFGAYCLVFGVLLVALGIRLRGVSRTLGFESPISAPSH